MEYTISKMWTPVLLIHQMFTKQVPRAGHVGLGDTAQNETDPLM